MEKPGDVGRPLLYKLEHIDYLRLLAETEKCSIHMICELTDMPLGTVQALTRNNKIALPDTQAGGPKGIHSILRERKISAIRQRYGHQISELFGHKKEPGPEQ